MFMTDREEKSLEGLGVEIMTDNSTLEIEINVCDHGMTDKE
jgi:hypothetical protein